MVCDVSIVCVLQNLWSGFYYIEVHSAGIEIYTADAAVRDCIYRTGYSRKISDGVPV